MRKERDSCAFRMPADCAEASLGATLLRVYPNKLAFRQKNDALTGSNFLQIHPNGGYAFASPTTKVALKEGLRCRNFLQPEPPNHRLNIDSN